MIPDDWEIVNLPYEDWMAHNLCGEVGGDLWFPEDGRSRSANYTHARAICHRCPVVDNCGTYAVTHQIIHGMWGGLAPMERRALRRGIA